MMDSMLEPREVAKILSVSLATLTRWRLLGAGPEYAKFGDAKQEIIRYERKQLEKFAEGRRYQNTVTLEEQAEMVEALTRELRKERKESRATIKQLKAAIAVHIEKGKTKRIETAQQATDESATTKTHRIAYLNKELKNKREECQRHKTTIRCLEEDVAKLTTTQRLLQSGIEQPKQQEKPAQKQISLEDMRAHILSEVHRWLVTSESPHQLIVRIKTMELPKGADD